MVIQNGHDSNGGGAGHLGNRSSDLIAYYEAVPGVQRAPEGLNPATWMLEVTMPGNEQRLGVDFAEVYKQSKLNRYAQPALPTQLQPQDGSMLTVHPAVLHICAMQSMYP